MSSIMRWRNGLMGLSVMAITPVSHEVSEPHDLETGRAILFILTSDPARARSRWGVYRESGLVLGSIPGIGRPRRLRQFRRVASVRPRVGSFCGSGRRVFAVQGGDLGLEKAPTPGIACNSCLEMPRGRE